MRRMWCESAGSRTAAGIAVLMRFVDCPQRPVSTQAEQKERSNLSSFRTIGDRMNSRSERIHVDPEIASAWTLAAHLYFDAETFAREKDRIFSRAWQVVGHGRQVEKAGDYFTIEVAGEPLLICRDTAGKLRAFYN